MHRNWNRLASSASLGLTALAAVLLGAVSMTSNGFGWS